jgi:hypothetical protein
MLKNVSEVTIVPKHFFLKILNFVQSFVECEVSLADGIPCRKSCRWFSTVKNNLLLSHQAITRQLEEFFRGVWVKASDAGVPISYRTSAPPPKGEEVVVVREVRGGVVEFERGIVAGTALNSSSAFVRVFLKDRGIVDECVHVSNVFPVPKDSPQCPPLVSQFLSLPSGIYLVYRQSL